MTHRLSSLNNPRPGVESDHDDRVMSKAAFNTSVAIGFVVLSVAAVIFGTSKIESDISQRTSDLLAANGLSAVVVEVSGTSVELKGAIGESPTQEAIFAAVGELDGVTSVDGQLWVVSETGLGDLVVEGDPIEVRWDANSVVVVGEISNQERKNFIAETLAAPFGTVDVDDLEVNDEIPDESDWIGTILGLVISLQNQVETGRLLIFPSDEVLVVTGEVDDKVLRNSLNAQIDEAALTIGFDANAAIRVPEDATPPPTQEEVDALQEDLDELVLDQVIEFETQSDVITPEGMALLDQILTKLESAPTIRVEISGHADAQGTEEANMQLSEDRTLAVLNYLVAKGQSPDRFDLLWFGETQPIASNDTEEGRARNRRIEFRALLEDATP
ncbi:MAG: OmpA family protein [Acidimicrobiia bacterium]|nr:OmpA family protein [Acidimicrobiia bacterium]